MPSGTVTAVSIVAIQDWVAVADDDGFFDGKVAALCYDNTGRFAVAVGASQDDLTAVIEAAYPAGTAFDGPKPVDPATGSAFPGGQPQPVFPGGMGAGPSPTKRLGIIIILGGGAIWVPLAPATGGGPQMMYPYGLPYFYQ